MRIGSISGVIHSRMIMIPCLALVFSMLACSSCDQQNLNDPVGSQAGTIEGIVSLDDAPATQPISLELRNDDSIEHSVQTSENGAFGFNDIEPGQYQLFIVPPRGYSPVLSVDNPIDIVVEANKVSHITIPLVPATTLPEGNLPVHVHCGGTPVEGVNVTVSEYETGNEVDQGETGEDGYAWFAIDAGLYDVGIDVPEGYELLTGRDNPQRGIWVASSDSVYVDFALKIQGSVEEGTLEVCTGLVDSLSGAGSDADLPVTIYDRDGYFVTSGTVKVYDMALFTLEPGVYSVGIELPEGYSLPRGQVNPVTVTIRTNETSRVGFYLEYDCADCPDGELIVSALLEADGQPGVSVRIFDMETGSTIVEGITNNTGQAIFSLENGEYGAEITLPEGFGLSPGQDNPVEHISIFNGLSTRVNFHLWDSSVPQPDGALMICAFSDSYADSIGDPPEDFDVDVTVFDAAMNICATGTVQSNLCISFDLEFGIYSVEVTVPSGYDLIRGENPTEAIEVVPNSTSHVTFVFRKPE